MPDALVESLQESVLAVLTFNQQYGSLICSQVTPENFDGVYNEIAAPVLAYWRKYHKAPGEAHLESLFSRAKLDPSDRKTHVLRRTLVNLHQLSDSLNPEYVASRTQDHVRDQKLKTALLAANERYAQGGDSAVPDVEGILHTALRYRQMTLDAGISLAQYERLPVFSERQEESYQLGIPELDRYNIGPVAKQLLLYIAPKNTGKCIAGEELVLLPSGRHVPIKEVVRKRYKWIVAFDESSGRFLRRRVTHWVENGQKAVYRLRTRFGRVVRATKNHPFLTPDGWRCLGDLVPGNARVAVAWRVPGLGKKRFPEHKLRLLAYLLADGCLLDKSSIAFSNSDLEIRKDLERCSMLFGCVLRPSKNCKDFWITSGGKRGSHGKNHVLNWLRELGLMQKGSAGKFIPAFIEELCDEDIAIFLSALFSCDLGISEKTPAVIFSSASRSMVKSVERLLMRLGVAGYYKDSKRFEGYAKLDITSQNQLRRLFAVISFVGEKSRRVCPIARKQERWFSQRPLSDEGIFDQVTDIEFDGFEETYDITVEQAHNFLVGGVIVHNSWFCVHVGRQCLLQKARVLHITLEMSEDDVLERYYQSFFAIATYNEQFKKTVLEFDELDRLTSFRSRPTKPKLAFTDSGIKRLIRGKVASWNARFKRLKIKEFPSGSLTLNALRGYLDHLELVEGFIPNVLIVDYPDLMAVDQRDFRIALGRIFVGLRGLGNERNLAVIAPTQSGRDSIGAKAVTSRNVTEDISKVFTADKVLTYSQTGPEYELGLARLRVEHARKAPKHQQVLLTQSYATGQYVLQSTSLNQSYWSTLKDLTGEDPDIGG